MTPIDVPTIFSDRDAQSLLAKRAENVLAALSEWGVGRIDERKTVHFT
jgi:hypothetical protein